MMLKGIITEFLAMKTEPMVTRISSKVTKTH